MLSLITKIGCIRFDDHNLADPISTIKASLGKCGKDLSDALIVLPEAVNVGSNQRYYSAAVEFLLDISVLEAASREFNVAFVAGLAEKSCFHRKTFNSAFLIDPEGVRRLSRKMHDDPRAVWYAPTADGDSQCVEYRGLNVASLICQDAIHNPKPGKAQNLYQRILTCLEGSQNKNRRVLCVPARMGTYCPSAVAKAWPPDINVAVANVNTAANSDPRPGGVRVAHREWKPCLKGICLEQLPSGEPMTP